MKLIGDGFRLTILSHWHWQWQLAVEKKNGTWTCRRLMTICSLITDAATKLSKWDSSLRGHYDAAWGRSLEVVRVKSILFLFFKIIKKKISANIDLFFEFVDDR